MTTRVHSRQSTPAAGVPAGSGDPNLETLWSGTDADLLRGLDTSPAGLSPADAASRLAAFGPNLLHDSERATDIHLLARQIANPIVMTLIAATLVSLVLGEFVDALIILVIVVASTLLGFWQERSASHAVAALLARVAVGVEVRRDDRIVTIPIAQIVPGDVVVPNAGDIIPGDGRFSRPKPCSSTRPPSPASLTRSRRPRRVAGPRHRCTSAPIAVFMGSHVVSGSATAVIAAIGTATEFGRLAGGRSPAR